MATFFTLLLLILTVCHGVYSEENLLDLRNIGINVVVPDVDYSKSDIVQALFASNISYHDTAVQIVKGLEKLDASDTCYSDITYILAVGLANPSSPEFKYIDAATKIPQGVMQGKYIWVGDYQECYSIPEITNPLTSKQFKGNYFTGNLTLDHGKPVIGPYPLYAGFCLPDTCNSTTATHFLKSELAKLKANYSFIPKHLNISVVKDEAKSLDHGAKGMIAISAILVTLVIIGTIVDVFQSFRNKIKEPVAMQDTGKLYDESPSDRAGLLANDVFADGLIQPSRINYYKDIALDVVLAFSFLRNSGKLVNTETAVGPLACLNGLRVLSMWWVILGHTYAFCIYITDNIVEAGKIVQRFSFQAIMNGTFSVDSFFFLSGLLVAYLAVKEFLEKDRFSWIYYFLHRYWRLTPLYAYVIFFYSYLYIYFFQGPFRSTIVSGFEKSFDVCKKYWWSNLIYINNFYPQYGNLAATCLGWSWYLANDMQFFWFVSPFVLVLFMYTRKYIPSTRNKIPGIVGASLLILACIIIRASLVAYYGLYGLQAHPTKHTEEPMGKNGPLYGRPYARMSVYVVGMLTGVLLAESKNRIRIPKLLAVVGWCVSIAVALAVVYGQYYYNHHNDTVHMTLTQSIFYVSLCRTLWGACLSWVVLACVSGNGGWVTQILSWKVWAPLGRLTYAAYLIHPMILFGYYFNLLQPLHFSDWVMVNIFLSSLVITYVLSFVISMFLEAPMLQIEKALLKQRQTRGIN